jgi:hypothetical protein
MSKLVSLDFFLIKEKNIKSSYKMEDSNNTKHRNRIERTGKIDIWYSVISAKHF